jgi:hypothetical protein
VRLGARRRRKEPGVLHLDDAFFENLNDALDIGFGVGGGKEARETFENVHALEPQVIVEETGEALFRRHRGVEDAAEIFEPRGCVVGFQEFVDRTHHPRGVGGKCFLQRRALLLEML